MFVSVVESQEHMEISPGDSTPTSEASYSHSSTPNAQPQQIVDGPVLLANARLASHPSTPNNTQLNYTTSSSASVINTSSSSSSGNNWYYLSSRLNLSSATCTSSCQNIPFVIVDDLLKNRWNRFMHYDAWISQIVGKSKIQNDAQSDKSMLWKCLFDWLH